ncbi:YdcF family protein [Oceanobacillus sp. 143]|uniref:DUF218 domain-containing protein n=1 Tax=Oceanobacillus zhaokaii TaxID=2052660 RepID=A0A345PF57_9BACI|nr:YdcF family protein [Oceanobacillus zhaokaii]AXI08637.1 hypothetical protein CUC15_06800 [Oceanobacillus zhaokaii]QGS68417.1 YdcF family protein [Oceanobacillus sp. 143]
MKISEMEAEKLTDEQKTALLYKNIEDDQEKGDCIFVLGSSKAVEYRLPRAIQLYKEGRAKKLLFSGGVSWEDGGLTEAELLRDKALELGVPEEDIIIENNSRHTKENVLASLLVLDRALELHNINRLLVVTTTYHIRRTHLTLKTYMPNWIKYSLCAVNDRTTREDNWFETPYGRERVEKETSKIIHYVKLGSLIDEEIELPKI